ncbi:MAG: rhodanese-like domain-containing protein [Phycisphaerales bacterium]
MHRRSPAPLAAAALLALAAIPALTALVGCETKTNDTMLELLEPPAAVDKMNTPGRFLEKAPKGVYVDPRSAKQYAEGHIPGAINVPLADLRETARERLAGYNLFVVYDTDYGDVVAKAASKSLMELGYKDVFTLRGGLKAWQKEGYTIAKGATPSGAAPAAKDGAAATK